VKKNKTFTVQVTVEVFTTVEIKAASLEEAITEARKLGVKDVVEFDGEFNDGSIEVTGAFE
jgi:hypothetical protein